MEMPIAGGILVGSRGNGPARLSSRGLRLRMTEWQALLAFQVKRNAWWDEHS